ncbi:sodium/calcium exchanger NCL2-like isoform X1 [Pistacia vera]|uniref:sodium/calcium exchanger NCL2-like isoform X1 n=1 Tax=Pistacia vera TaxID=55513 RepID=UPI00126310E9|nr:sodium/calcium exchanger NCL2-like isoform X1 [Pistacia vera]
MARAALFMFLLLPMIYYGSSRSIKQNLNLLSDGMNRTTHESQVLELIELGTTVTCEPVYSFLPCSSTVWGQLFMLVVYELLLSLSQQIIQSGSNLFFQMFGTGIFGASLFNVLGMFPQIILVIVIGVSGDSSTIQSMAAMGMAMLAGSAIMQLTVSWGSVVAFGSYDLSDISTSETSTAASDTTTASASSNSENKKPFSLTGYGVETDKETRYTSMIMLLSMIPVLILQLAKVINSSTGTRIIVLISLVITLIFLICYMTYQVFQPWIQNRRLDYLLNKFVQKKLLRSLLARNGQPNVTLIKDLFRKIDKSGDAYISNDELRALILGIQFEEVGLDEEDFATKVMEEFDISGDAHINEKEFVNGLSKWLTKGNNSNKKAKSSNTESQLQNTSEENKSLLAQKKESKSTADNKSWWNYIKAAILVIAGTTITIVIGTPLMQTVQEFSTSANIPSFAVSYVVIPLALGYKQMLLVIKSAGEKTEKAASLTFSELYGGVFMNNIMGLAIFLLLVYIRDLTWDVSAEVLVILVICTAMGLFGSFTTKIPFWTCIIVYLLYPISLLLLYILTEVLGWA